MKVLITGGTGFFGMILKSYLKGQKIKYINFDLFVDDQDKKRDSMYQGDLTKIKDIKNCFHQHGPFDAVYHLAAQLAHDVKSEKFLWESNVIGTKNLLEVSHLHKVKKFIFTSSNCLWGTPVGRPVKENDKPSPIELYGKSKLEAEKIIWKYSRKINTIIFRSPTIIAAGRMGLLTMLYEFINENRKVYLVGNGNNRYQFIYAFDYANAIYRALKSHNHSDIFNIGSDNVKSFNKVYQYVIDKAGSKSKIFNLPKNLTLLTLKLLYKFKLSPLGPYQYKMIAEDFEFDTKKIKKILDWSPTRTNEQMLLEAYKFYIKNKEKINKNHNSLSAYRRGFKMGIIKLVKFLS